MGKIVKFCSKCEESFAEKFSFCPNCANELGAFEMKPVGAEETAESPAVSKAQEVEAPQTVAATSGIETETATISSFTEDDDILELDVEGNGSAHLEEEVIEEQTAFQPEEIEDREAETFVPATPEENGHSRYKYNIHKTADPNAYETTATGFHATVLEDNKYKKLILSLLLPIAAFALMLSLFGVAYSLFNKDLDLAAVDIDELGVLVPDLNEAPMEVDEPEELKDDEEGGGGGGGGRDSNKPTSQGQLAPQVQNPLKSPSITDSRANTLLKLPSATQGTRDIPQTDKPFGDPNSTSFDPSDGPGSGGGQGTGLGRGQGSGQGTGIGSGIGSGSGSGRGDGNGDGEGPGGGRQASNPPKPQPPKPAGPTQSLKILSKPRPSYTDAARQNNVQGTVTLRVTFLSSGQIGSISPVKGLGYGLTEKAIAAARSIRFEPQMVNGVPQTVTKSVQFSFTIY